ncbi:MAG: exodeoxyribonuclease V subunit gamma [Comamonadaceae bacterium]|nr:exodeoxyribonuclease V subunit gamma [Comamonadaceae bacterium]
MLQPHPVQPLRDPARPARSSGWATSSRDRSQAQQVIVPSTALQRRVELALADRQGICAHVRFSYLAQWLWTQIGQVVPVQEVSPFAPDLLAWRVFEALGDGEFTADHPRLAALPGRRRPGDAPGSRRAASPNSSNTTSPTGRSGSPPGRRRSRPASRRSTPPAPRTKPGRRRCGAASRRNSVPPASIRRRRSSAASKPWARTRRSRRRCHRRPTSSACPRCRRSTSKSCASSAAGRRFICTSSIPAASTGSRSWTPKRLSYLAARRSTDYHEIGNRLLASWGKQTQAHIDLLLAERRRHRGVGQRLRPQRWNDAAGAGAGRHPRPRRTGTGQRLAGCRRSQHRGPCLPFADTRTGSRCRTSCSPCSPARIRLDPARFWWRRRTWKRPPR